MEKLDFNLDSQSQKTENPTIGRTLSFAERFANLQERKKSEKGGE